MPSENALVELKLPFAGGRRPVENGLSAMAAEVDLNWLFDLQKKEGIKIQGEKGARFPWRRSLMQIGRPFRKLSFKFFSVKEWQILWKADQDKANLICENWRWTVFFSLFQKDENFRPLKCRVPGGIPWHGNTELNSGWKIEINSNAFHLHCAFL